MARALLLTVSLAVLTLALSPGVSSVSSERHPIPDGPPLSSPPARSSPEKSAGAQPPRAAGSLAPEVQHSDSYCLICHSNPFLQTRFSDGRILALYVDARQLRDSAHNLVTCLTCHDDYVNSPPDREDALEPSSYRAAATEICIRCHVATAGDYADSAHGQPVLSGSGEGATCNDCHSPLNSGHAVVWVSDPQALLAPGSVHENCGRCHEKELDSYRETSHHKVARFGDPQRPATCTTCHGEHSVEAIDDPEEPLTTARLVAVCEACHHGANEAFASGWLGHATSPSRSTGFYYAERFIVLSIAASVAFGLLHMTLDFLRALAGRGPGAGSPE